MSEEIDTELQDFLETVQVGNGLVYSCSVGGNADVFPDVLKLHVTAGSVVVDVTYGKGVFWKKIPQGLYDTRFTDLKDGVDFRKLPYGDLTIDAVVIDPPYMHTPGGSAHQGHQNYEEYYRNNQASGYGEEIKYHEAVLRLYQDGFLEAKRVLRDKGVLIIKCQDEVCAGKMRLTMVELTHYLVRTGWTVEDLFVVMSNNRPGVSRMLQQKHSRRNHSYFLVAKKKGPSRLDMRLSRDFWP